MERRGLNVFGQMQRNMLRDRRPSIAAYPACLAMGTKDVKFTVRKNKVCTGPTKAAKDEQKSVYRQDKPNKPTKDPFSSVSNVRFMVFIGSNALVQYCEIHLSHCPIILCYFISVCTLLNVYRLIVCTL
jgi:hypothetical protein